MSEQSCRDAREFEQQYAERSGVTVEWLHARNQYGIPCDCGEPDCQGWQMKHIEETDEESNRVTSTLAR